MEFYRGEISYGEIPYGKISVKIIRKNFRAPYFKNRRKIAAKSRQDRRKILCGARRRKEREFLVKIYDEISPPKARLEPAKRVPKDQKAAVVKSSR